MQTIRGEHVAITKISAGAIITLLATGIFLTLVTAGIIATQTLSSNGVVKTVNVGVYSDSDCEQNCTSINWGLLYPGDLVNKTVYVKNIGTVPITLSMNIEKWLPEGVDDYLSLSWDQEGAVLQADESVSANFVLSISENTKGFSDFSFDIVVIGAE